MNKFNEDSRVKIPAILHLYRLGYEYISLKDAVWDTDTNIFTDIFKESIARINLGLEPDDIDRLLVDISLLLDNEDLGKVFFEKITNSSGVKLIDLIARPQVSIETLMEAIPALKKQVDDVSSRKEEIIESANIKIKYEGYIKRERVIADKITRLEDIDIKDKFNYKGIQSISTEAREKLTSINPQTIAQASRIPGITPNDISVLLVLLGR